MQNFDIFKIDEVTQIINCRIPEAVSHLMLSGQFVTGLCSLYISEGRNLALKEKSEMSEPYVDKVVDGDNSADAQTPNVTCADIGPGVSLDAWWKVTFFKKANINRIVINNKAELLQQGTSYAQGLRNFTLLAYLDTESESNLVYSYTDPGGEAQEKYVVVPSNELVKPVKEIRIDTSKNLDNHILSVCEIIVYGESACPPGMFGLKCERACNCHYPDDRCLVSTGTCYAGCAIGYKGEDCYEPCEPGTYGLRCYSHCSEFCASSSQVCNMSDGSCIAGCQPGYKPPFCNQGQFRTNKFLFCFKGYSMCMIRWA
ncbi:fibrinogen-related molecule [Plakobranchus ocellatus]|uniref:Fibrinogen-related molecule n=1 Tax=Plakobranchus ocellatus TaxID=259542 RepID=A0AAV4AM59_9GAST|nr:fibrinogen-related molecule [Plakobranchus ocellatus]